GRGRLGRGPDRARGHRRNGLTAQNESRVTLKSLLAVFTHPLTQRTRVIVRRTVATLAVALAVAVVTSATVDLGPALKSQAETQGSKFIERPMHIGRLSVRLWNGAFELDDFVIEGLSPQ